MLVTKEVLDNYKKEYLKEEADKYVITPDAIIESIELSVEEMNEDIVYFLTSQGYDEEEFVMTHNVCLEGQSKCLGLIEKNDEPICLVIINLEDGKSEIYS